MTKAPKEGIKTRSFAKKASIWDENRLEVLACLASKSIDMHIRVW
jgi:hypothetical protein